MPLFFREALFFMQREKRVPLYGHHGAHAWASPGYIKNKNEETEEELLYLSVFVWSRGTNWW